MIVSLAASLSLDNDLEANRDSMKKMLAEAAAEGSQLVLFGEAYLHGFEALSFNYEHDIKKVALGLNSPEITKTRQLAIKYETAMGFGFFENDHGGIYCTYLIVDEEGEPLVKYQRVSRGWREPEANAEYRMGTNFPIFEYGGKKFGVMVCGDFWEDELLDQIVAIDPEVDAFIWPVHCDYLVEEWSEKVHDEYRQRSQILAKPIFFINNVRQNIEGAKGGAYIWQQGKELAGCDPGLECLLTFKLE